MSPALSEGSYVFVSCSKEEIPNELDPIGTFRETEGTTLICSLEEADLHSLNYDSVWRMITLRVHSSLEAIGFLQVITAALGDANIPANVVSAYFHDHLFVPESEAERAFHILNEIVSRRPR